jgi:hypothetical protein
MVASREYNGEGRGNAMPIRGRLGSQQLLALFTHEVTTRSGEVVDTHDDGNELLVRALLSHTATVQRDDPIRGGVALRANDTGVWIHPYLRRKICVNGAIVAQAIGSRYLDDITVGDMDSALDVIRDAIGACCQGDVFAAAITDVRAGRFVAADVSAVVQLWLQGSVWQQDSPGRKLAIMRRIVSLFESGGDRSRFGLANAVTAVARDVQEPLLKWDLEEFGGGIAVGKISRQPGSGPWAAARRCEPTALNSA